MRSIEPSGNLGSSPSTTYSSFFFYFCRLRSRGNVGANRFGVERLSTEKWDLCRLLAVTYPRARRFHFGDGVCKSSISRFSITLCIPSLDIPGHELGQADAQSLKAWLAFGRAGAEAS